MVVKVRLGVKYIEVGSLEVSGHVRSVAVIGRDKWGQVPEHQEHEIQSVARPRGQCGQVAHLMNWLYRPAVLWIMRAAWDSSCWQRVRDSASSMWPSWCSMAWQWGDAEVRRGPSHPGP